MRYRPNIHVDGVSQHGEENEYGESATGQVPASARKLFCAQKVNETSDFVPEFTYERKTSFRPENQGIYRIGAWARGTLNH
jgi:hypothetical protein